MDGDLPARWDALLAVVETKDGHYRRHAYFSLPAAQRALDRAEARGVGARLLVCRLTPLIEVQP